MRTIETVKGMKELRRRYVEAGVNNETYDDRWLDVIDYAIENKVGLDDIDYQNTPKELKPLWKGLK